MIGTRTALLIIDVQIGSFRESTPLYKGNELLKNLQLLISKAHVAQASIFSPNLMAKQGHSFSEELLDGRFILRFLRQKKILLLKRLILIRFRRQDFTNN